MRLRLEFVAFFILVPLVIAMAVPPDAMFRLLFVFTLLGLVLLHATPGFAWGSLARGLRRLRWRFVAGFCAATVAIAIAVVLGAAPQAAFLLLRDAPALMLAIALLYPALSALPQEIVFRPLYFRRYAAILPGGRWTPIVLNAAVFSWAHLMYWSWIVAAMTFAGGLAFAWSYERHDNFPEAVLLHALAGIIVFASGLGLFFYSGNVQRPF
jgi:membrane protease YdiL (CAAX protease family)